MFTGIIEETGTVMAVEKSPLSMKLTIWADAVLGDVHIGDSIAVNGVCLTVTQFTNDSFTADVMPETVKSSNLQQLKIGSRVNLERAMAANGRFGGHFVSGHVDGTGVILRKRKRANALYMDISLTGELSKYGVKKGSIAVDGISLTIADIQPGQVTVSLIPQTMEDTVLGAKKEQDTVNLEHDLIGKYVVQQMERQKVSPAVTEDLLKMNGFF